MTNGAWIERLKTLLGRLLYLGLDADIAASSIIAAWSVYSNLSRLGG
jgi:hypothetical protein